jgi:hypothetical protein
VIYVNETAGRSRDGGFWRPPRRKETMSDRNEVDLKDAEILTADVTDEALENAGDIGHAKAAAWTLGACTGISVCPG